MAAGAPVCIGCAAGGLIILQNRFEIDIREKGIRQMSATTIREIVRRAEEKGLGIRLAP